MQLAAESVPLAQGIPFLHRLLQVLLRRGGAVAFQQTSLLFHLSTHARELILTFNRLRAIQNLQGLGKGCPALLPVLQAFVGRLGLRINPLNALLSCISGDFLQLGVALFLVPAAAILQINFLPVQIGQPAGEHLAFALTQIPMAMGVV